MDDEFRAVLSLDDNPFGTFELPVGDGKTFAWNKIRSDFDGLCAAEHFKLTDLVEVFYELRLCFFRNWQNADGQTGCLDLPILLTVQKEKEITRKHRYLSLNAMSARHAVV